MKILDQTTSNTSENASSIKAKVSPSNGKFLDPFVTAKNETRASVTLTKLDTLWLNTGTLCNITCQNCYIKSSPTNNDLVYLSIDDVLPYLDEANKMQCREIGITGGEPFMNPHIIKILDACLTADFDVLLLTNAMKPMMRPRIQEGLMALREKFPNIDDKLTLRISLDHYAAQIHDMERGDGAFETTMQGMQWLNNQGFTLAAAGRMGIAENFLNETDLNAANSSVTEADVRDAYKNMFAKFDVDLPYDDPSRLVLFPEMDEQGDPPEITVDCWDILNQSPDAMMCANSRMIVKRNGEDKTRVLSCTLLAYDDQFSLGHNLTDADKTVQLNHPHCATFCVLGGASCSA